MIYNILYSIFHFIFKQTKNSTIVQVKGRPQTTQAWTQNFTKTVGATASQSFRQEVLGKVQKVSLKLLYPVLLTYLLDPKKASLDNIVEITVLCPRIERLGGRLFYHCPSVCLHKLDMKT